MKYEKDVVSKWLLKIVVSIFLALIAVFITGEYLFTIQPLRRLELNLLDSRFLNRGPIDIKETADVVILEITQETYNQIPPPYNSWPWPRSLFAKLIENLNNAGVRGIGIDILMPNPDKFSPENDELLKQTILKYGNIVVAGRIPLVREEYQLIRLDENYNNIFSTVDGSVGIVQVASDNDGVYRRYSPFVYSTTTERFVPTFGFALLNKYFNLPPDNLAEIKDKHFIFYDREIPKYDETSLLVNFYGSDKTFPRFNFIDILDDEDFLTTDEIDFETELNVWDNPDYGLLHSGVFKDKIVLIGSTMPEDKDILPVSMSKGKQKGDNLLYGVEFHANAIQNIINQDYLYRLPEYIRILNIFIITIFFFFLSTFLKQLKTSSALLLELLNVIIAAAVLYGFYELSNYLFKSKSVIMPVIGPTLSVVFGYFGSTAYHFILERKQKTMIKGMFSHYVSGTLVDQLVLNPEMLKLGGDRREMTVFFSDIAGFSTFSEKMEPEDLVNFLNQYLSAMTEIVIQQQGTLDKYEGDAIMAFWGAPIHLENHALLGCKAALLMQKKLEELKKGWADENHPDIFVRMGINTGPMVVGNIGGKNRFDYTVMGDNVNLASRLEGANKQYGTSLMISEQTYVYVKNDVIVRDLDLIIVKGKTKPINVYELIALKDEVLSENNLNCYHNYSQGIKAYREKDFNSALYHFNKALEFLPNDPPSILYVKRCTDYINNPPAPDWDGVYIMTTK